MSIRLGSLHFRAWQALVSILLSQRKCPTWVPIILGGCIIIYLQSIICKYCLGSVDVDFALKTLSRNVNNPVNVDLASNINFSAKVAYDIRLRRRTLRLKYSFETPFWGIMFVPMGGASYFEMFELGNLSNAVHFSSLHNKQGYDSALRIDIPFRHSSWQFGISSNVLTYKANGMVFNRSISSLEIAWVYDLYIFRGMKDKAPNNFIKPNF